MKIKHIVLLSVCTFLLLALFQAAGMSYAYRSQMQKTEATLASAFKNAFTLTTDAQVNRLPYPEGTVTHMVYAPDSLHLEDEDRLLYYAEQTSVVLQDAYGQPEISLDSLRQMLTGFLRYEEVEGSVFIRKFNVHTGCTLQTSPAKADLPHIGIGILTSPRAFVHMQKGIAVEAILDMHYLAYPTSLLFPSLTLLLAILLAGVITLRIHRLRHLQHDIDRQCKSYYQLAGQMAQSVQQMEDDLKASHWTQAGETGRQILADTEAVLTRAKQENARQHSHRVLWLDRLSWGLMPLALLLPVLWGAYIYRTQWKTLNHETEVAFEKAFVAENDQRYLQSIEANHLRGTRKAWVTGSTDYFHQQVDSLFPLLYRKATDEQGNTFYEPRFHGTRQEVYVLHQTMNLKEGIRLYRAYGTQQIVNERPVAIPLDTFRLDSLFRHELMLTGLNLPCGIRILRPDSGEVLKQTGCALPRRGSFVSTALRLDESGSVCVQGIVPSPQSHVFRSAWYLFLPLALTFAFCLLCTAGHWFIWRRQRRLEQFRKDFTYSMIHDMKSPLQSILMGTQIMTSGKLDNKPEKAARICTTMCDECNHLLALSARVVTLTQIDRGELQLHRTAVPLRPLFEELATQFRLKAAKPVTFHIDCTAKAIAHADAFCLREMLSNLIDNAIKYSGEEVSIHLTARQTSEGSLSLSVRDNGIGIPRSEQQRIFNRFERIQAGDRRTGASGFGLGLNFVMQVVQAHGGTVTVDSDGKSFSTFTVTLPEQ